MRETTVMPSRSGRRKPLRAVFLAVLLGLLAGFVHGWNLSLLALLLLVILFNVRARLFLLIWAIGVGLSWLLVPISYAAGRFLLDSTPLGSLLGLFNETPAVAMLAWDRYTVAGGTFVAMVLSIPAFITVRGWIQSVGSRHRRVSGGEEFSEFEPLAKQPSGRTNRVGYWLFVDEGTEGEIGKPAPLIRPLGMWGFLLGLGAASVTVWWLTPQHAYTCLLRALAEANRAEVNVGRAEFDLWTGRMELTDVALADPEELTEDRLRIAKLSGDFDPVALLQGRLEIGCLRATGIDCNAVRERLAHCVGPRFETSEAVVNDDPSAATAVSPEAEGVAVTNYVRDWSWAEERIQKLNALCALVASLQQPGAHASGARGDRCRATLRRLREARSDLGGRRPRMFVRSILVERLPESWQLGASSVLRLADVNSDASLCPRPIRVEVDAPEARFSVRVTLDLRRDRSRRQVEMQAQHISLAERLAPASSRQRLLCDGGFVSLQAKGWFEQDRIELTGMADASDLQVRVTGERPMGGISPELWNESLNAVGSLRIPVAVEGPIASPRLHCDAREVALWMERRLRAAGETRLASLLSEHLGIDELAAGGFASRGPKQSVAALSLKADGSQPAATAVLEPPDMAVDHESISTAAPNRAVAAAPVTERVQRLPPVPLPVVVGGEVDTDSAPVSVTLAASLTEPSVEPAVDAAVCQAPTNLPPLGEPASVAETEGQVEAGMGGATVEMPSTAAAAPMVGLHPDIAQQAAQTTNAEMSMTDPFELPTEDQGRPRFSEWTRGMLARIREAWPLKRQTSTAQNPFDPDVEHQQMVEAVTPPVEGPLEAEETPQLSRRRAGSVLPLFR